MGLIAVTRYFKTIPTAPSPFTPSPAITQAQNVPGGLTRFINDSSYMPQSETTIAVDPSNPSHVVGGVNDGRFFFCPDLRAADCPNGYTDSVSGFTTSTNGGTSVAKSNDLPSLTVSETNLTSHASLQSLMVSWGDPSLAAAPNGNFYYGTLAIDPVTGASGIELSISNSNLWDPAVSCSTPQNAPATNSCWTGHLVFGNLSFSCSAGACSSAALEDKDTVAVDMNQGSQYFGDAYIAWDHFLVNGESESYVARCTPSLACTMISGGGASVVSGSDPFAGFATVQVGSGGAVYLSWCNFGTATTLGPVFCSVRASGAGGASFGTLHTVISFMGAGTELAGDSVIQGFATEQFRTSSELTMAAGSNGALYFAVPVCLTGSYFQLQGVSFLPGDNPGICGGSAIIFTHSTDGGATWSTPAQISSGNGNIAIQPSVAVDPSNGNVVVAYYSTQFDPFNHRIDVMAAISKDQGQTFTSTRVTPVSNEPNNDPALFNYFAQFGGALVVPQYGDYITATALGGKIWVSFTGNYATELGTYQTDPFLAVVGETPSVLSLGSNAKDAAPGASVSFDATGLTSGTSYSLTMNWSSMTVNLANGTVASDGSAKGNFTVPNVESQVYTVTASDAAGLSASSQLGVGQVSIAPLQAAIQDIQASISSLSAQTQGIASSVSSLSTSIPNELSSLNGSISKSLNGVQSTLGASIAGASSDLKNSVSNSFMTVYELLGVAIVLIVVAIFFAARARGKQPDPIASKSSSI